MKELVLSASVSNCFPELNSLSWKLNLDRQIRVWKVIWEWERLTSHPTQPFWWKTQAKYYVVTVTALWMPLHFGYELLSSCMCLRISSGVFVMLRFYFLTKSWYDQGWCKLLVSQYCSLDFGLTFFLLLHMQHCGSQPWRRNYIRPQASYRLPLAALLCEYSIFEDQTLYSRTSKTILNS
jgi:hypothetical protein